MEISHLESTCPNRWVGRNGRKPNIIVCHVTEGYYNGAISWFQNTKAQASSHFIVGSNGQIAQMVSFANTAWCNGDMYLPTSKIVKAKGSQENPNLYSISIEHEGFSYKERYGALTEAQFQATLYCCKEAIKYMRSIGSDFTIDRDHIIGHYEINSVNKINCPAPNGKNFPFDRLIKELQNWDNPPIPIGSTVYITKDTTSYETAGYGGKSDTIKKGTPLKVFKYHTNVSQYVALTDLQNVLIPCAWVKGVDNLSLTKFIKDDKVYLKENTLMYSTAGYGGTESTSPKGSCFIVEKYHTNGKNTFIALKDELGNYPTNAWLKGDDTLTLDFVEKEIVDEPKEPEIEEPKEPEIEEPKEPELNDKDINSILDFIIYLINKVKNLFNKEK